MNEQKLIYFISDVHLKLDDSRKTNEVKSKVIGFLKSLPPETKQVVFVGDIFDFWYEWYFVVPAFHFELFHTVRTLIEKGIRVTYLSGNHDFYLGRYLSKEVGMECVKDSLILEDAGKKFWIYHGDGIAKSDGGYRVLKKILRSKLCNFLFRTLIPADLGILIAKATSQTSRKHRNKNKLKLKKGEYISFAEKKISEGFNFVIIGHRHFPEILETGGGIYLNTGDWMTHFSYGVFDGENLKLETYNEKKPR
jgi:UDP-2,3-diacylglucosamine hydrolase